MKKTENLSRSQAVRLGLMPPLTGIVGLYGSEISMAGRIACEEVNEAGGVLGRPLALIIEDDGSLPSTAVAAAERLIDRHKCVAIIGNLLSNSRIAVAYQVAEPRKVPYLNFSFYEGSIISRYFFHFAALPNQQIDRMIPYMRNRYGPRMFFAGHNYEWPRGSIDAAKRALEQSGGEVAGEEYFLIGAGIEDIECLLDQVAASGADVFVPYFAGVDQLRLLTLFAGRGLKDKMAVVMGHYDEVMSSLLPPDVREGLYSSNTYFMTLHTPENGDYLARLSRQPGIDSLWPNGNGILTNFGEGAYLCVKAFASAANKAGSLDAEAQIEALETTAVVGPQGSVRMDPETHHAHVNTYLARCRTDGSFEIVERFGAIAPVLPERYRHLRIIRQPEREDIYLHSRMMAQMTEAVLLVRAADSVIVYANPGAGRMFGYSEAELTGRNFSSLFAPSGISPEDAAASIGSVLSRKGVWEGETEHITCDGRRFWCTSSASVFTHPRHGEVWMILNKNITKLKRTEEDMNERMKELRAFFHLSELAERKDYSLERFYQELANVLPESWKYPEAACARIVVGEDEFCSGNFRVSDWMQASPVKSHGSVIGKVEVGYIGPKPERDEGPFLREERELINAVAERIGHITERKRVEEELRSASLYARSLIESSLDPLVTIGPDGKITDVNTATEQVTGLGRGSLIGTDFCDYFTDPGAARAGYRQVFKEGFVRDYPLEIRHRDGHLTSVLYNASVYKNEKGEVIGVFAAARDITEKRRAEKAAEAERLRFFSVLETLPAYVVLLTKDYYVPFANRFFRDRFGEANGMRCYEYLFGRSEPCEVCETFKVLQTGTSHRWEWTGPDGRNYDVHDFPFTDEDGRTLILEMGIDITEGRKAEEALKKSEAELKEAQRFAGVGNWKLNWSNGHVTWSEEIYRIFGRDPAHPAPSYRDHPDILTPESFARLDTDIRKTLQTGNPFELDLELIRPDGSTGWITARGEIEQNAGGITLLRGTALDINQRRRLEDQLRHAQKMEAVGTLAGGIAHDFNNILNVILGYGNMVLDRLGDDALSRDQMNEVLAAAERAANLTKRLLLFSRKQAPEMKPVDVNEIITGLQKMISRIIGEDIDLRLELSAERMVVMADSGQMEQVLMNLMSNARDAMPRGGRLTISTEASEIDEQYVEASGYGSPGAHVLINVTDTGTGMDTATKKKIFEPFFTTKGVGEGTGLGLAIVYGIIKQHHGFITVYSEPARGTTFKIYIPLIAETEQRSGAEAFVPLRGGEETILLAEDDEVLRNMSKVILESFGYTVITAEDGRDAVEKFREYSERIDLIMLDMMMPRMSGREAYEEISGIRPGVKTLFASGYTMAIITRKEMIDEGVDLLLKPISPKDLLRKVREILDR